MSTTETISFAVEPAGRDCHNEADVAATAFFARYSGRTFEAYRYDLRSFFQWAADVGLEVLFAACLHRTGASRGEVERGDPEARRPRSSV